jgi:hypothetical protein
VTEKVFKEAMAENSPNLAKTKTYRLKKLRKSQT